MEGREKSAPKICHRRKARTHLEGVEVQSNRNQSRTIGHARFVVNYFVVISYINSTKSFYPLFVGNSFSNYGRFKKHLKEIHETNDHEVLQDTAALMNSLYEKIYQPEKPEE